MVKASLSPRDLAQAVGVSESSLKRWADDGRLEVSRTAGGHRRIPIQEAIRFVRDAKLPVVKPDMLGLPDVRPAREARTQGRSTGASFHARLEAGDTLGAQAILVDLYLDGQSIASICDGPVREAMTEIGNAWNHGREGIFVEHRATDICLQALSTLRSLIVMPAGAGRVIEQTQGRPVAVGCAPSGDPYLIPSLACACVLSDLGFNSVNLGPDTPPDVLLAAVREHEPLLVWLSCSTRETAPSQKEVQALSDQVAEHGATLVVGGRVLDPAAYSDRSNPLFCQTMGELDRYARGLLAHHNRSTPALEAHGH